MRLVIVRHGKAEPDSPDGTDHARRLRARGERQADFVGAELAARAPSVARVLSSDAARAWSTAARLGEAVGVEPVFESSLLVDEPASVVVERLAEWSRDVPALGTLVLVGHNPQVAQLVAVMGGDHGGMRTGEAAILEIDPRNPIGGVLVERVRLVED